MVAVEKIHQGIPAKIRLGDLNPGQQVLDTEVKLIHTGIRMAAYNTLVTIAPEIRTNTGYRRANQEAHALMYQMFNQSGTSWLVGLVAGHLSGLGDEYHQREEALPPMVIKGCSRRCCIPVRDHIHQSDFNGR
ncbi:hypothetical protein ACX80D_17435 [Arthrobacter sp. Sr24]